MAADVAGLSSRSAAALRALALPAHRRDGISEPLDAEFQNPQRARERRLGRTTIAGLLRRIPARDNAEKDH
ncbi:hypothetical protein ACFY9A_08900 [Streptomyces rubradiris]|uniref:hypothetical protein n=1 Tax=Streptomyces rubradiris TaxID=285531 RepID=UPI003404D273